LPESWTDQVKVGQSIGFESQTDQVESRKDQDELLGPRSGHLPQYLDRADVNLDDLHRLRSSCRATCWSMRSTRVWTCGRRYTCHAIAWDGDVHHSHPYLLGEWYCCGFPWPGEGHSPSIVSVKTGPMKNLKPRWAGTSSGEYDEW